MTTNSRPTASGGRLPSASPSASADLGVGGHPAPLDVPPAGEPACGRPGRDPLQRWLVTLALALVAAILAATLAGCGGGPPDEPPDGRAAIPAAPPASQAV